VITSPVLSNVRHRAIITPVIHRLLGSFILNLFVRLVLSWKWELSLRLDFKSNVLCKSTDSKNIQSDMTYVLNNT